MENGSGRESCQREDSVVWGPLNLRVIAKGTPVYISRPVQKLYPTEIKSTIQGNNQIGSTRRVKEQERLPAVFQKKIKIVSQWHKEASAERGELSVILADLLLWILDGKENTR